MRTIARFGELLRRIVTTSVSLAVICLTALPAAADTPDWPRDIETEYGKVTVYPPQLETFTDDRMTGRAAVAVILSGTPEPLFGAMWYEARLSTDREERTVYMEDLDITGARFPGVDSDMAVDAMNAVVEGEMETANRTLSLDALLAQLDVAELEQRTDEDLQNDPPKIIHINRPALLVSIDGDPRLVEIEGSKLMQVVNTPFFIAFDASLQTFYLFADRLWYTADEVRGPWKHSETVPEAVSGLIQVNEAAEAEVSEPSEPKEIVVATEPAELVSTDGRAEFQLIRDTELMYVANTESDVFVYIPTSQLYVLLSGRWYVADSADGPWTYVPSEELPEDFSRIDPASPKGNVLASVAGTQEATDAVLDTYIPQTAQIRRDEVQPPAVDYDGEPDFEPIEGTEMQYAVNSAYDVVQVESRYYCCHEAVWYEARNPKGPWVLCTLVPEMIYTIPPSCPVYRVKYVRIYYVTPQVVYVGYTPGYVGCYVSHGTVVYGTGYVYTPWCGTVCYPRHSTWGLNVHYDSYYGWSVGLGYGWSIGGIHFSFSYRWGSYRPPYYRPPSYRPPHYRPPYRPPRPPGGRPPGGKPPRPTHPIARPPCERPPGERPPKPNQPIAEQLPAGTRPERPTTGQLPGTGSERPAAGQLPAGGRERPAAGQLPAVGQPEQPIAGQLPAARPEQLPGDLYADREGNVYRRDLNGWQQHTREGWRPAPGQRPTTPSTLPGGGGTRPVAPSQLPSTGVRPPGSSPPSVSTRPAPSQPIQQPSYSVRPPGATLPSQRPSYSPQVPASRPPSISTRPAPSQPRSSISDLNRHQRARQHGVQRQMSAPSRSSVSRPRPSTPSARPAARPSAGGGRAR